MASFLKSEQIVRTSPIPMRTDDSPLQQRLTSPFEFEASSDQLISSDDPDEGPSVGSSLSSSRTNTFTDMQQEISKEAHESDDIILFAEVEEVDRKNNQLAFWVSLDDNYRVLTAASLDLFDGFIIAKGAEFKWDVALERPSKIEPDNELLLEALDRNSFAFDDSDEEFDE